MATFGERLSSVLGTNAGYDPSLRRSIQNAALFEAKRIIDHMEAQRAADDSLEHLRAFQRKYVFWELAKQVLDTTHLQPEERAQVLWRKMTTKEPLGPETAWKRVRTIEKELESLADAIRPLLQAGGRSEEQAIDEYIAQAFEASNKASHRAPTRMWGYTHNHCLLCYVMYFKNARMDPDLPPATAPRDVDIPRERPGHRASAAAAATDQDVVADLEAIVSQDVKASVEERRAILKEVREHLEILKEFQELVPEEELNKRKRELFLALPDAPPPAVRKPRLE
jgi:hypothetical protein